MKRFVVFILAVLVLFGLCACSGGSAAAEQPEGTESSSYASAAIDPRLVNVFGTPADAALAELELSDAPYDEEAGGIVAEYEWCGVSMKTVINPNWTDTGEIVSVHARTECENDAEMPEKLQSYVEMFTMQFGEPINYSTEIANEEARTGHVYEVSALADVITAFADSEKNCALTFRFALPERAEEDLEFAECAFYKDGTADGAVSVSLHMLRLSELDYEVTNP